MPSVGYLVYQALAYQTSLEISIEKELEALKKAYWDACKLPRKKKKKERKRIIFLYNILIYLQYE